MHPILNELSCVMLPGKFSQGDAVPTLYNDVYRFWRETWLDVFTRVGSPQSLSAENFMRQDVVIALHLHTEVVGLVTVSVFNLNALPTYDHAYLQPFPKTVIDELRQKNRGVITTGEYLSVHPSFRKSVTGVPLSDVLTGLELNVCTALNAHASLATAVRPAGVPQMAAGHGYYEVGTYQKYGLDCALLYNGRETKRPHGDSAITSLVEKLWKNAENLTRLNLRSAESQSVLPRIAA